MKQWYVLYVSLYSYGSWLPGGAKSQGFRNHGMDLVFPEHSWQNITAPVKLLQFMFPQIIQPISIKFFFSIISVLIYMVWYDDSAQCWCIAD